MGTAQGTLGAVVSEGDGHGNGRRPLPSGPVPRLRPAFQPGAGRGVATLCSPQPFFLRGSSAAEGGSFSGDCSRCGGLCRLGGRGRRAPEVSEGPQRFRRGSSGGAGVVCGTRRSFCFSGGENGAPPCYQRERSWCEGWQSGWVPWGRGGDLGPSPC